MRIIDKIRKWRRGRIPYTPLIEVILHRDRLRKNLSEYRKKFPQLKIAPVLKSNAYGHGLFEIADILDKENVPFLITDSLFEAHTLRAHGIRSKILISGYTSPQNIYRNTLKDVSFTVGSLAELAELASGLTRPTNVHLKIDTGMHRQGIFPDEVYTAIELLKKNSHLYCEGLFSHLSDADNPDQTFTLSQIERWNEARDHFMKNFPFLSFTHLAASSGIAYSDKISANTARLGLGLYGINRSPFFSLPSEPVLEMRTVVSDVKHVPSGEFVGYGNTFQAERDTELGVIPAGYFEGMDRRLSNTGFVKIGSHFPKIVGRVSMNITTIDVTGMNILPGSVVTLVSGEKDDPNSAESMAKFAGTIPYEILIHIPQHLRRVVV